MGIFSKNLLNSQNKNRVSVRYRLSGNTEHLPIEIRGGRFVQDSKGDVRFKGSYDVYRLVGYEFACVGYVGIQSFLKRGKLIFNPEFRNTFDRESIMEGRVVSATLSVKNMTNEMVYHFSFSCNTKLNKKLINKLIIDKP